MRADIKLDREQVTEIIREYVSHRIYGHVITLLPDVNRDTITERITFDGFNVQVELEETKLVDKQ